MTKLQIDKIRLWATLHGKTIEDLKPENNCQDCQWYRQRCYRNRRLWGLIKDNKLVKIIYLPKNRSNPENDQDWTCIEFTISPKK
jgi:hypothetical protein